MLGCHYFPLSKCVECMQCGWSTVCQSVIVWCDDIGLVSLIYLGWELICVVYIYYCFMCTSHPDLVCLLFVPSLYSTF